MSHNTFGHLFPRHHLGRKPRAGARLRRRRLPAGIAVHRGLAAALDLDKRKPGQSKFTTQRREDDLVKVLSGVMPQDDGETLVTTGTPVSMMIENTDQRSKDYSDIAKRYRPGHADFTYDVKYGVRDYRGGGRSSARETAARVAAGGLARKIVPGLNVRGALVQIGAQGSTATTGTGRRSTQSVLRARSRDRPRSGKTISTASARPAPRSAR
jgi:chorismate synthase